MYMWPTPCDVMSSQAKALISIDKAGSLAMAQYP